MKDLFAAVCLVAVLEGLFLFVAPFAWKRMAERLLDLPSPALRSFGGLVLLAGLSLLWWARHYRLRSHAWPGSGGCQPGLALPASGRHYRAEQLTDLLLRGQALVDANLGWHCRPVAGTTGRGG
ncbi:DUF2065 family protein [Stenotrophomonas maltophilia]|uniref:DUF2065 domain-containing protein n=1 Tax=Stenotrophomonas maltophilia TaxID=40324 RepID=UPI0020CF9256|nr:DUF2065 family protein [Stenotrophomonas maltophilia]